MESRYALAGLGRALADLDRLIESAISAADGLCPSSEGRDEAGDFGMPSVADLVLLNSNTLGLAPDFEGRGGNSVSKELAADCCGFG